MFVQGRRSEARVWRAVTGVDDGVWKRCAAEDDGLREGGVGKEERGRHRCRCRCGVVGSVGCRWRSVWGVAEVPGTDGSARPFVEV